MRLAPESERDVFRVFCLFQILLIVAFCFIIFTVATVSAEQRICFDLQDGQRIVSIHEQLDLTTEMHDYCLKQNNALNQIIHNSEQVETTLVEQVDACDNALKALDRSSMAEREICEASVDAATPSIW